jgi:hypothetical protein
MINYDPKRKPADLDIRLPGETDVIKTVAMKVWYEVVVVTHPIFGKVRIGLERIVWLN